MRKYITKEVVYTTLTFAEVFVKNGKVVSLPLDPITVAGRQTERKIENIAKKEFPGKKVMLLDQSEDVKKYRMKIEDFIANAELTDEPDEDEDEDEE